MLLLSNLSLLYGFAGALILGMIAITLILGILGLKRGLTFLAIWALLCTMYFYIPTLIGYSFADARPLYIMLGGVALMAPSAWLTLSPAARGTGKVTCHNIACCLRRYGFRTAARVVKTAGTRI